VFAAPADSEEKPSSERPLEKSSPVKSSPEKPGRPPMKKNLKAMLLKKLGSKVKKVQAPPQVEQ